MFLLTAASFFSLPAIHDSRWQVAINAFQRYQAAVRSGEMDVTAKHTGIGAGQSHSCSTLRTDILSPEKQK